MISFIFLILDRNDKIDMCGRMIMVEDTAISNEYAFRNILDSCSISKRYGSKELSATQKSTIVRCSHQRQDEFHTKNNAEFSTWKYHTDCYSAYTCREKIERHLRKRKKEMENSGESCTPAKKRLRRKVLRSYKTSLKIRFGRSLCRRILSIVNSFRKQYSKLSYTGIYRSEFQGF